MSKDLTHVGAAFLTACVSLLPLSAQAETDQPVDIPAQSLTEAIAELGQETGLHVSAASEILIGKTGNAVQGTMTPAEALDRILAGTGINARLLQENSIVLGQTVSFDENADGETLLDTITITTRRFEEDLQDVPGSVSVLTDEELEKSDINDVRDYTQRLGNVNFSGGSSPADSIISIRGFSDLIPGASSGPVNGIFVDEVILNPNGTSTGIDPNLLDLERVEVAFGPQGTTFGRGTIGGAVNLVTKKPSEDFEASVELVGGSFPNATGRAVLNGSLTGDELLTARLVAFGKFNDGFIETPNLAEETLETNDFGGRLSLRSQPTDRITIDWSGSFDRSIFDQLNTASAASFADGDFVNFSGTDGTSTVDRSLISLRGEYEADIGTFITNTSYLRVVLDQNNDTDESPFDIFFGTVDTLETSIAQEFRFESEPIDLPLAGETSFVVGTNFSFNSVETDTALIGGSDLAFPGFPVTGGTSTILGDQDIFNFGVFGDARFKPTEKLELGVGLRFSRDVVSQVTEGEATGLFPFLGAAPVLFDDEETFSAITPRGSVKYNWTDDFSTFVSIATGYRPGGFNTSGLAAALTPTFEEENAITFDGGFKSSWYDGRLIVNGSGFATIYNDIQVLSGVLTPTGIIAALDNAATARSIGAEIGVRAEPVDGLRLLIDYGLSKATFTDFIDSNGNDLTGTTLPNAPTHTLGFSIEYARSVFNDVAEGFIRWEHSFTSSFVTTLTVGGVSFDSRDIANLRAGLRGERFETEVFVENLFDEVYANGTSAGAGSLLLGIDPPLDVGPPRMIGARARIKF